MNAGRPLSERELERYEYLSTFCWDEYYYPMDGPYQNYTYFPKTNLERVRGYWRNTLRLIREGRAPRDLGLYLHWPFCPSQCTYCYCSMAVPKTRAEMTAYLGFLKGEMDEFRGVFEGSAFDSVWLGGGTPTFMSDSDLDGLLGHLRRSFALAPGAQVYVEASPATLTASKLEILLKHGVNRLTLGVQTMDDSVLSGIDRKGQTREAVARTYRLLSKAPGLVSDIDLMIGLEGQSRLSFVRDVAKAVGLGPSVMHLFAFDDRPQTLFAKAGKTLGESDRAGARVMMELAERIVRRGGYRRPTVDPEAGGLDPREEKQDGAVRRYGASVLGLGHSAVSHAFGSAWYCHPLVPSDGRPASGPAPFFALESPPEEEMRGYALRNLALYSKLSRSAFASLFGKDPLAAPGLAEALADLAAAGVVSIDAQAARWTSRDPVQKLVLLKRLYSDGIVRRLMRGRGADLRRFRRERAEQGGGWHKTVRAKIASRSLFRVYFKESAS